jgi:nitrogen-specific signal transduction histidine kinase
MSAHPLSFSDVTARPRMAPPTAFPFPEFALSGPAFAGPASAAPLAASAVVARPAASVADGAGLAHDAGNLMGALGLYSALLSRPDVLRPEHRHYAEELTLLSQRSRALIDRLLVGSESLPATAPAATTEDVPTKNSGPSRRTADRPADAGSCDPHWVLDQLAPLLRSLAAPHELSLHSSGPRTTLPFSAEILERIAVNLVCNATQAMTTQATNTQTTNKQATPACGTASGSLRLRLLHHSGTVVLEIEDAGPGMPLPQAARLITLTSSVPRQQGVRGLGLRIVRELATATDAAVEVHIRRERGTTIRLQWKVPARQDAAPSSRSGVSQTLSCS